MFNNFSPILGALLCSMESLISIPGELDKSYRLLNEINNSNNIHLEWKNSGNRQLTEWIGVKTKQQQQQQTFTKHRQQEQFLFGQNSNNKTHSEMRTFGIFYSLVDSIKAHRSRDVLFCWLYNLFDFFPPSPLFASFPLAFGFTRFTLQLPLNWYLFITHRIGKLT